MSELEPPSWSLADHLRNGQLAIKAIANEPLNAVPQPICHHFDEISPVDPMIVSRTETYSPLRPKFEQLGLKFESDRLEAWEVSRPTIDWFNLRIRALVKTADANSLIYLGWTWEPLSRSPLGACTITVINNRTAADE